MIGLKKHVELIEPIPQCVIRLRDLGVFPSLKSSIDSARFSKGSIDSALVWCVSSWLQSGEEQLDQAGRRWVSLIESSRVCRFDPEDILDLHSRVLGGYSFGFRKGPVAVDENGPYGFVSATTNVAQRLVELNRLIDDCDAVWRVVLIAVGLTFLHPFGDGNGRLVRVFVAAQGSCDTSRRFAIAFARRMKVQNSKEFAESLAFLRFGEVAILEQFCLRVVDDLLQAGFLGAK